MWSAEARFRLAIRRWAVPTLPTFGPLACSRRSSACDGPLALLILGARAAPPAVDEAHPRKAEAGRRPALPATLLKPSQAEDLRLQVDVCSTDSWLGAVTARPLHGEASL